MDPAWLADPNDAGFLAGMSDSIFLNLDPDTLSSLVSVPSGRKLDEQAGTSSCKRARTDRDPTSLSLFLSQCDNDDEGVNVASPVNEAAESNTKSDDGFDADEKARGKRELSASARNKACRERARRERLNGGFAELAKLIDPDKAVKADKASIVVDAVRVITQLRAENNQLKQLNKFLEEKVADNEKCKGQLLMQQALLQQQARLQHNVTVQPQQPVLAPQFIAQGVAVGMPAGQSSMQTLPNLANLQPVHAAVGPQGVSHAVPPAVPSGLSSFQGMFPNLLGHPLQLKHDFNTYMLSGASVSAMPPTGTSWLPTSTLDISQDHKLRPPAA